MIFTEVNNLFAASKNSGVLMLKFYFIAMIILILQGCGTQKSTTKPLPVSHKGMYVHVASKVSFPERIGDFQRTNIANFNPEGTDTSATYYLKISDLVILMTAYVYPAPLVSSIGSPKEVIDQAKKATCDREYSQIKQEIIAKTPGTTALNEENRTLKAANDTLNGNEASFLFPDNATSTLYFFCPFKDSWTLKFRATYHETSKAKAKVEDFLNQFASLQ
jgi:hypothetical protein